MVFFLVFYTQELQSKRFQHLTADDGLSSGLIYKIAQDSIGYMWFATGNGLNRFSGNSFTRVSLPEIGSDVPTSLEWINTVTNINNKIYAGTRGGSLLTYDYKRSKLDVLLHMPGIELLKISAFSHKELLVGSSKGVFVFNLEDYSYYWFPEEIPLSRDFIFLKDSILLVASRNGLKSFSLKKDNFGHPLANYIEDSEVLCIHQDKFENIWAGTESNGLFVLDTQRKILHHKVYNNAANVPAAIRVITNRNESIFLGADDIGIHEITFSFEDINIIRRDPDKPESLSLNSIRDIYFDKNDRMWIATTGGGINLYDPNLKNFEIIRREINNDNSLVDNMIRSILEDSSGNTWIGTENGLSKWNPGVNKWTHFNAQRGLNNNAILCLAENDEYIIAGTYGGGLNFISKRDGRTFFRNTFNLGLKGTSFIFSVLVDRHGNIWYGGHNGNMGVISPSGQETTIEIDDVRVIREIADGSVLVGSFTGIYSVNPNTKEITLLHSFKEGENSLSSNFVYTLIEDLHRQCLWIGTEGGGLSRYDYQTNSYKHYTSKNTLPTDIVYGLVIDQDFDLWMGTNMGIVRYDPERNIFRIYQRQDGLPSTECNFGAYSLSRDGKVFFGTTNGVVSFYPQEIYDFVERPNIVIKAFEVNGIDYFIPPGQVNINFLQQIKLQYNQNSLNFHFEAIEFTNLGKNTYQWFMEGFDQEWSKPSAHNIVTYNNLRPGKYTLYYIASNCDGLWMQSPKKLQITIVPPFWKSTIAYFLYFFVSTTALFFIGLLVYLRNRERISVERIRLFVNLAHDIRTPLSIIKLASDKLITQHKDLPSDVKNNLGLIVKNSERLNRFVVQLLDFQRQENAPSPVNLEVTNLESFISEVVHGFQPVTQEKKLQVLVNIDSDINIWIDRLKFEKVVNNFLSNSVKYTHKGGRIEISCTSESRFYCIQFSDNGIGIPESGKRKIFKRFYRAENTINLNEVGSGIGLVLSKALIEDHGGKVEFTSSPESGTSFTIRIPKNPFFETVSPTPQDTIVTTKQKEQKEEIAKGFDPDDKNTLVMIVEDNIELRNLLNEALGKTYRVVSFNDGKEAYVNLMEDMPDIVISDVMMPCMGGYELCYRLKNDVTTSHIPVVLITALSLPTNKLEGIETGADAYLEKPIDLDLLQATIRNLVRSRRMLRSKMQTELPSHENSFSISDNEFLARSISLIKKHIADEEFSVEDLSRELGVSRSVLFRRIKAILEISPSELILKTKLNYAVSLMRTTKYSISEIATSSGFNNPKYFSTVFKKIYSMSPKEYQQELKQKISGT